MRFDQNLIEQIRSGVSIVDVVSQYVTLKKSGLNHAGLCPFHSEKTPSFLVSDSKQIFKCFGCGEGGDVFKFLMLMEGLTFPESVQQLAERTGVPLPQSDPRDNARMDQRRQLLELMAQADRFFRERLAGPEGAEARAYLDRRGVERAIVEQFGLGFAPPGSRLLEALKKQGTAPEDALLCGLVKERGEGDLLDKFRNRIMFPIRDLSGRTIAFGGRALGDGLPKYLNSPETPLYQKSRNLYGLEATRDEIRRKGFAILVEGYFDCLMPYQFGFRNVAASLGTSLTESQVRLLGRYTRQVVINYDPDSAGQAAAIRSVELFLSESFRVNITQLPAGLDPDSFLRQEGGDAYQEKLKASAPFIDYILSRLIADQRDPKSPRGKQEIVNGILPHLLKIPDRIERSAYISRIGGRVGVDEELILAELRKLFRGRKRPARPAVALQADATPAEKTLLAAVLEPQLAKRFLPLLESGLFEGLKSQSIFEKVLELRELKREISIPILRDALQEEEDFHLLERIGFQSSEGLSEEGVRESIRALQKKQDKRLSRKIQEELAREETSGDASGRVQKLMAKKLELDRRKVQLDLA